MDARFLLCARKAGRSRSGGSRYELSHDPPADDSGARAPPPPAPSAASAPPPGKSAGTVASNFVGTQFSGEDGSGREVAAVTFGYNVLGLLNGPRRMSAAITVGDEVKVLRARAPRYSEAMKSYCLNFCGRVAVASVKNFQLELVDEAGRPVAAAAAGAAGAAAPDGGGVGGGAAPPPPPVLQFGKVSDDVFTLDYCHPISALQAFMVALASCDSKLACE